MNVYKIETRQHVEYKIFGIMESDLKMEEISQNQGESKM